MALSGHGKRGRSRFYCEHIGGIAESLGVSAEYLITGNVDGKDIESLEVQQLFVRLLLRSFYREKRNVFEEHKMAGRVKQKVVGHSFRSKSNGTRDLQLGSL